MAEWVKARPGTRRSRTGEPRERVKWLVRCSLDEVAAARANHWLIDVTAKTSGRVCKVRLDDRVWSDEKTVALYIVTVVEKPPSEDVSFFKQKAREKRERIRNERNQRLNQQEEISE